MRQRIIRLLIQHSSFTKFIFLLYYSHIVRVTIAAITKRTRRKNIKSFVSDADEGDHLLHSCAEVGIASGVQSARVVIAKLEENFASIPDYNSPLKIMPLGDSITYGVSGKNSRDSGGYRTELWHKFIADGLQVKMVGSQSHGPDSLGDKAHEGHPGWTIGQIAASVNEWLNAFQPDLILLMIGTNDTRRYSLKTMINEFSALIDQITAQSPDVQLLVASIPPIHPVAIPAIRSLRAMYFNTAIPAIVDSKVAQGKKVTFVDMRSLTVDDLTSSLSLHTDDGLHPNAQGYSKIALLWHEAVLKVISNRKSLTSTSY